MGHRLRLDEQRAVSVGFARLLARLHADPDRAAAEYERLRLTLQKFFDWHGAWPPEECADVTLDRLAVKLAADTSIEDVHAYSRGIARLVLLEWRRRPAPVSIHGHPERAGTPDTSSVEENDEGTVSACFERCLAALPDESRALVLAYYVEERRAKIENRRRLARALGLSDSALRNRVQRVRDRLEQCVRSCTEATGVPRADAPLKHRLVESDIQ